MTDFQKLSSKMGTLERRAEHLERQLNDGRCSDSSRSFIVAELSALETAVQALRLKYLEIESMQHPIAVMRELIEAVEKLEGHGPKLTALLERASVAVTEFEATAGAGQKGKSHEDERGLRPAG
jgi:prefoldin subunit 5